MADSGDGDSLSPEEEVSIQNVLRGRALAILRTTVGVTVKELIARTGLGETTIYNYERGRSLPNRERLDLVLSTLGLGLSQLERAEEFADYILRPKRRWGSSDLTETEATYDVSRPSGRVLVGNLFRAAQDLVVAGRELGMYLVDRFDERPDAR